MGEKEERGQSGRPVGKSLWHHRNFLKLWAGQSLSEIGSGVTQLALPTTAILLLGAGPFVVGLINTLPSAAFLLLGIFAGAAVDRFRRRPVLILSDILRMAALAAVPLLYLIHRLGIWELLVATLVAGVGGVFFGVAYRTYLPSLVGPEGLLEGNAKLQTSSSAAQILGPSLAAVLIQALRPTLAILADALSYAASITTLLWIRAPEPLPTPPGGERSKDRATRLVKDIGEGFRAVVGQRIIRGTSIALAMTNGGWQMVWAVLLIFAYRSLHLAPGPVAGVFALTSVVSVMGALSASRLVLHLGAGPLMVLALSMNALGKLLLPLAALGHPLLVFAAASMLNAAFMPALHITVQSLRQTLVPSRLLGRTNATVQTMNQAGVMLGALAGGLIGSLLGPVPTILIGGGVTLLGVICLFSGPSSLRSLPISEGILE